MKVFGFYMDSELSMNPPEIKKIILSEYESIKEFTKKKERKYRINLYFTEEEYLKVKSALKTKTLNAYLQDRKRINA